MAEKEEVSPSKPSSLPERVRLCFPSTSEVPITVLPSELHDLPAADVPVTVILIYEPEGLTLPPPPPQELKVKNSARKQIVFIAVVSFGLVTKLGLKSLSGNSIMMRSGESS